MTLSSETRWYLYQKDDAIQSRQKLDKTIGITSSMNAGNILMAILAMFCSPETSVEQVCSGKIRRGPWGSNYQSRQPIAFLVLILNKIYVYRLIFFLRNPEGAVIIGLRDEHRAAPRSRWFCGGWGALISPTQTLIANMIIWFQFLSSCFDHVCWISIAIAMGMLPFD